MGNIGLQFADASVNGNFLLNSLEIVGADTRGGLCAATREKLNTMQQSIKDTDQLDRLNAYIRKITNVKSAGKNKNPRHGAPKP